MDIIFLIGRILLGGFFLYNGYNHFANLESLTGYAKFKNVPMPKEAVIFTGLMLLVGGASVLLNIRIVIGMAILVLFLVVISFMMHAFWKIADKMEARMNEQIQFNKNMALAGALLMMIAMIKM